MDFSPLAAAGPAIQIHAVAAVLAFVLGTAVLLRRKGDRLHKAMGRVWVASMAAVALSSFWITEIRLFGPYSWLHALSIITLVALVQAIWSIWRGDVRGHRIAMVSIYVGGLLIAGGFTLLPGRRMYQLLFADGGTAALALGAAMLAVIGGTLVWRHLRGDAATRSRAS